MPSAKPRRSGTFETLRLTIELLRRIPRGHKTTAAELHEQLSALGFDRDLRTIQRQLDMLSEHFEIERDERSKPYGYRWKEQSKGLGLPMLSPQESMLLKLAEQHLRPLLPTSLMKAMGDFFSQADANLRPHTPAVREREWLDKVRVVSTTQPLLPPTIKEGVFEEVSNALYCNQWLKVDYKNAAGKRKQAEVMPLGLAQQGPRLYLVCRFQGYDNERSLALHRIRSAQASTHVFERPKDFSLERYDDDGRFGFGEGKKIHLRFRIRKETGFHLLETPLSKDQQVKELDDDYEISATVVDSAVLEWWLRGFGDAVTKVDRSENESQISNSKPN